MQSPLLLQAEPLEHFGEHFGAAHLPLTHNLEPQSPGAPQGAPCWQPGAQLAARQTPLVQVKLAQLPGWTQLLPFMHSDVHAPLLPPLPLPPLLPELLPEPPPDAAAQWPAWQLPEAQLLLRVHISPIGQLGEQLGVGPVHVPFTQFEDAQSPLLAHRA